MMPQIALGTIPFSSDLIWSLHLVSPLLLEYKCGDCSPPILCSSSEHLSRLFSTDVFRANLLSIIPKDFSLGSNAILFWSTELSLSLLCSFLLLSTKYNCRRLLSDQYYSYAIASNLFATMLGN